jgi:murein DD-endopeptidase MepM/ murein hydrolase activator NlpD
MAVASGAQAQVALDRLVRSRSPVAQFADGFDFPVGKPDARGYYRARGFRPNSHPGEDWDGVGGGDSDFNDPVSSLGDGEVVFAGDARLGWGNVVIVRHQFREKGEVQTVNAFFAHLNTILVQRGQRVVRGQQIGMIGTAHGRYDAHLHFEIRKNLAIGTNRAAFPSDFSCYYDPTKFITAHRRLEARSGEGLFAFNRALLGRRDTASAQPPSASPAPRRR